MLIDEAHRSHSSTLHMNLLDALPNCARIGFTGTPIIMGAKKKTTDIFGDYIDTYRLADAERDGAVVPILYSGRTVKGAVRDGRDLDEVFEDMFADHTEEELDEIQRRYATKGDVLAAEKLIAAKAKNILRHYVDTVLPGGFKAQLVAYNRRAVIRYRAALLAARDDLVSEIDALPQQVRDADPEDLKPKTAELVRASRHLDLIKAMDFVPVISAGTANDEQQYSAWTDPAKHKQVIDGDFLKPFPSKDELAAGRKPAAFLIVKSMLRTEIGHLAPQRDRLRLLFTDRGCTPAATDDAVEECVELLEDGPLRDRFEVDLKRFLTTVDTVLPDPAVKPYLADAHLFARIAAEARRRYRIDDGTFDPSLYGEKVRELIDRHMESLGVDPALPPVSLSSADFQRQVAAMAGPRARASEMEHAIRHHISVHFDEDPVAYRRLSERLEQILADHAGNWEQQALFFAELAEEIKRHDAERGPGDSGLTNVEQALYGLILERTATDGVLTPEQGQRVADFARRLHTTAATATTRVDFWRKPVDWEDFKGEITGMLIDDDICLDDDAMALADALFEVIKANRQRLRHPDAG